MVKCEPAAAPRPVAVKTMMIVEDNDVTREGLAAILNQAGYGVVSVDNGRDALDHLRAGKRVDLILLDMFLPVVDGWKFLEELQDWSRPLRVPIIITTGTILTREWAKQHGCAGFLHKPFDA